MIQGYMNDSQNEPLIVHGESGSGKTSIMAMAVKNAWSTEVHRNTILILLKVFRFLGTTPDSSNIGSLLLSVINQIRTVYNQDPVKSGLVRLLLNGFVVAKQKYEDDTDICSICDALQLSQKALQYNPQELSSVAGKTSTYSGSREIVIRFLNNFCKSFQFICDFLCIHNLEGTRHLIANSESVIVYNAKTLQIEKSFEGLLPWKAGKGIQVFPSKREKVHQILCDEEYINHYKGLFLHDIIETKLLDKTTLLSLHYHELVRVFNFETGKYPNTCLYPYKGTLLKRLFGHTIQMSVNKKSIFFITYANDEQTENAIRVWDKETYDCLASYCMDFEVNGGKNDKYKPHEPLDRYEKLLYHTDVIYEIIIPYADAGAPNDDDDDDST
ncbi:hypothetical protein LOTGIDRAFT_154722 [Lottia gigantea]|uniref:NACHT domain-containing protein n=1 Tax=Lottia gigantea TaxID=225164 RepID=V4BED5_LOTGI|nr:hypothetical protein LOTGIDRAFT_154722 [Lottia gigantea]ESO87219.1 hypothetical protein LOTGIDRAFT_154722 [Lottia gigantea]